MVLSEQCHKPVEHFASHNSHGPAHSLNTHSSVEIHHKAAHHKEHHVTTHRTADDHGVAKCHTSSAASGNHASHGSTIIKKDGHAYHASSKKHASHGKKKKNKASRDGDCTSDSSGSESEDEGCHRKKGC